MPTQINAKLESVIRLEQNNFDGLPVRVSWRMAEGGAELVEKVLADAALYGWKHKVLTLLQQVRVGMKLLDPPGKKPGGIIHFTGGGQELSSVRERDIGASVFSVSEPAQAALLELERMLLNE